MSIQHGIKVPAHSEVKLGPEELLDREKQKQTLKFIRGNFLEIIVSIEQDINHLIEKFLSITDEKVKLIFKERILLHRGMNLSWKSEFFKSLIEKKETLPKERLDILVIALDNLISERNKWAHGTIHYKQEENRKLQSYLEYINSKGILSELKLTNEYFDKLNEDLEKLEALLREIEKKLT